jgi:hypothetical protein
MVQQTNKDKAMEIFKQIELNIRHGYDECKYIACGECQYHNTNDCLGNLMQWYEKQKQIRINITQWKKLSNNS